MNGQEIRTFEQFVAMMMGSMVDGVAQRIDLQLRRGGDLRCGGNQALGLRCRPSRQ